MSELFHPEYFKERLKQVLEEKNKVFVRLFNADALSWKDMYEEYSEYAKQIKPFVCNTIAFMDDAIKAKKEYSLKAPRVQCSMWILARILMSSSSSIAGGAATGTALLPGIFTGRLVW
ncbi:MAG: adenylosuccinate synthetase [Candidatus Brocadiaceae bacterium]